MKRLMITLSAAAMAFGLFADGVTLPVGENFNNATEIPSTITDAGESTLSEVGYTLSDDTAGLPDLFQGAAAGTNLVVKTSFSTPAYYSPLGSGVSMEGLYFDSLVKFTACDEDAVVPDGSNAKIMVWVKEDETAGTTNLMVTAGFFSTTGNAIVPKVYDCGPVSSYNGLELDGTKWCRLTIKAYKDITDTGDDVAGFVLFVNAKTVTMSQNMEDRTIGVEGSYVDSLTKKMALRNSNYALFPSMVSQDTTVTAVGFAGQGAVDDLSFTDVAPTTDGDNGFTDDPIPDVASVTINGVAIPCADEGALNTALAGLGAGGTAVITLSEGDLTFATEGGLLVPDVAANVTIDLKGQTITGADGDYAISVGPASTLTITNSIAGGKVVGTVYNEGTLNVQDGTFDGMIWQSGSCYITGGAFLAELNTDLADNADFDPNMGLVQEGDYYVVAQTSIPKHFFIYVVDNVAVSNEYEEGAAITPPGNPTPAKAWETFVGWQPTVPATMGTADITVTAQFKFLDQDANNNYLIANAADLDKFKLAVAGDATLCAASYKLTDDIALTGTWTPIAEFKGTFDGGNKAITGLVLPGKAKYEGFFATLTGATVKDLSITIGGFAADASGTYGGAALAGLGQAGVAISGVTVNGTISGSSHNSAGIVCKVSAPATFTDCVNNANVSDDYTKCGGIINYIGDNGEDKNVKFIRCTNNGTIATATGKGTNGGVGGMLAYFEDGAIVTFEGCVNNGTLQNGTASEGVGAFFNKPHSGSVVNAGGNISLADQWPQMAPTYNVSVFGGAVVANGKATWYETFAAALAAIGNATTVKAFGPTTATRITFTEVQNVAGGKVGIGTKVDQDISSSLSTYAVAGTKLEAGVGFWTIVADTPAEDWDHPATTIVPGTTKAAAAWPSLADTALAQADAAKLVTWAKDTTKGNITFDNADQILVDAFLLDCANTAGAVATAKAAFKVTSITQDKDGNWVATVGEAGDGEAYKNGFINIVPYELEGAGDDAEFFQATLTLQPAAKE